MKKYKRLQYLIPLGLSLAVTAGGCTYKGNSAVSGGEAISGSAKNTAAADGEETVIVLDSDPIIIDESGTYRISGTLEEGNLTVNVDKNTDSKTVYLIFDGVNISSTTTAPVHIKEAEQVVIILEKGTVNTIVQGSEASGEESDGISAAIYSKADLSVEGQGSLTVRSEYNDGITSKDDLIILGGSITVDAVGDGLVGKDLLSVEAAQLNIRAGKDGMRSTNADEAEKGNITISSGIFKIVAANDAIQAEHDLEISDGTFTLTSGGGYTKTTTDRDQVAEEQESTKGLKAGVNLTVSGGTFTMSCLDDAVHSNGDVTMAGGAWQIETGDDGIHADGHLTVEQGELVISNSYEGLEGSDITINGGTIHIISLDDGINVNSQTGTLTLNRGEISISSGGDGLDSNGDIIQNGGSVVIDTDVLGPGDTAVDYDGTFTRTDGTITDTDGAEVSTEQHQMGGRGQGKKPSDGTMPERERPFGGDIPEQESMRKGVTGDGN